MHVLFFMLKTKNAQIFSREFFRISHWKWKSFHPHHSSNGKKPVLERIARVRTDDNIIDTGDKIADLRTTADVVPISLYRRC